ncbi:hypothetical protein HPB50_028488 [Hyalomma asiaticum]|nr:hypothetical protein HPB50_028488 [Hyalomma asiaticum]
MQSIDIDAGDVQEDNANDGGWNLVQRKTASRKRRTRASFSITHGSPKVAAALAPQVEGAYRR